MANSRYPQLVVYYSRWICLRAGLHRGWWLVTSLYLVIEAQLTALQLVLIGTAQGIAVLVFEVPTGLVADRYSRKWSIVMSHLLMGTAMLATSRVVSFEAILLAQMLWGISWTFSSGADVAWLTDEVADSDRIGQYLANAARWELIGSAIGLAVFGVLAWQLALSQSMAIAGMLMCLLGAYVAILFAEKQRADTETAPVTLFESLSRGICLAKSNNAILCVLAVTFLVNGADEILNRLYVKHLVGLGMPTIADSMLWLTMLGIITLSVGALAMCIIQASVKGDAEVHGLYAAACAVGAVGLFLFARAPGYVTAMAGFVIVTGVAWTLVRTLGVIWANRHASNENRATVQSFLSFSENLGEITLGFALAMVAQRFGISIAVQFAALAAFIAFVLIIQRRPRGR